MTESEAIKSNDDFVKRVRLLLEQELVQAGEELIDQQIAEMRREMRRRIAKIVIGLIDRSYDAYRAEDRLRIEIKLDKLNDG